MAKLFADLQELDEVVEPIVEEPIAPEEVITAEEDAEEVANLVNDTEKAGNAIDEATEVTDQLEDNIETIDTQLEKPEEVTEVAAVVATEALNSIVARLGYKSKKLTLVTAHESIKHPVQSLEIAREGTKEVLGAVVTKIKQLFETCIANIKNFIAKMAASLMSSTKAANDVLAGLQKAEFVDGAAFSEDQVKTILHKLAGVALIGGGTIGDSPVAEFKSFLEALTSEKDSAGFDKLFTTIYTISTKKDTDDESTMSSLTAAMEEFTNFSLTPGLTVIAKAAAEGKFGDKLEKAYPFRIDGTTFKFLLRDEKLNAFRVVVKPIDGDFISGAKVDFPKKAAVMEIVKATISAIGEIKSFSDSYTKAVKAAESVVGKLVSKEDGFVNKTAKASSMQNARVFAGQFAIDRIYGLILGTRAVMSYAVLAKNVGVKGAAKKEEK